MSCGGIRPLRSVYTVKRDTKDLELCKYLKLNRIIKCSDEFER